MNDPQSPSLHPAGGDDDEELLRSVAPFLNLCKQKGESLDDLDLDSEIAFPSWLTLNGIQMAGGFLYELLKSYRAGFIQEDLEVVEGLKAVDWSGLCACLESLDVSDENQLAGVLPRMDELYMELMRLLYKAIEHQDAVELIKSTWPKLEEPYEDV